MSWIEAANLAGAFAVPLVAVAALFYGMMRVSLGSLQEQVKALVENVHAIDVRLARLEERIPPRRD
ncbi:MAG: hypothetical protein OXC93_03690 [Rhodospirillaceae bacterium]|nr:hypothetical protein [Rhodospirillaceae bacterium]